SKRKIELTLDPMDDAAGDERTRQIGIEGEGALELGERLIERAGQLVGKTPPPMRECKIRGAALALIADRRTGRQSFARSVGATIVPNVGAGWRGNRDTGGAEEQGSEGEIGPPRLRNMI